MINKLRKMLNSDRAVSPVIAVILMVAITVVLAATVYVWVSGFGSQSSSASKSMALSSSGAIADLAGAVEQKTYTVSSATPGMKWSDVKLTLNGAALPCDADGTYAADGYRVNTDTSCTATDGSGPATVVSAGDRLVINDQTGGLSGSTLRILDSNANSVILTLVVG